MDLCLGIVGAPKKGEEYERVFPAYRYNSESDICTERTLLTENVDLTRSASWAFYDSVANSMTQVCKLASLQSIVPTTKPVYFRRVFMETFPTPMVQLGRNWVLLSNQPISTPYWFPIKWTMQNLQHFTELCRTPPPKVTRIQCMRIMWCPGGRIRRKTTK